MAGFVSPLFHHSPAPDLLLVFKLPPFALPESLCSTLSANVSLSMSFINCFQTFSWFWDFALLFFLWRRTFFETYLATTISLFSTRKMYIYRTIKTRTNRLRNSFFFRAVSSITPSLNTPPSSHRTVLRGDKHWQKHITLNKAPFSLFKPLLPVFLCLIEFKFILCNVLS